ncbi:phage tail tape measure protein [Parageobacillus thermoglucosidasius]|uniref:Phage tail tape measure protein n=1 Tax=Parageobacillus thermoglucosidasius TaxID=1426 RepID=A0A1B7KUN7_PARTM|nr:phage tail tape measure protein [Parageobacillus thermoglucosidasius]OAT73753.1 phage tail tape measure protein [Parageobacillus thermoglucosidasius]
MAKGNSEAKVTFKVFNQEFNKAIQEMKNESAKLRKEFQLQTEQLKQNGTETDRLAVKLDYLKRAQEIAKQQVLATQQQLEKAKATFGENSVEAEKLARQLLDAQIAEQRLANQINATEKELSRLSQQTNSTTQALNKLKQEEQQLSSQLLKTAAEFDLQKAKLGANASETDKLKLKLAQLRTEHQLTEKQVQNLERQLELSKQTYGQNAAEVQQLEVKLLKLKTAEQKLANEISQTKAAISQQTSEMQKAASKVEQVAQSFENAGNKMSGIGQTMSGTVTPALTAVGAIGAKAAIDVNNAATQIQTQLDITADKAARLEKVANDVWKKGFGEDLAQATEAVGQLYNAVGDIPDQELAALTSVVLALSKTFGSDVSESVSAAKTVMTNFGLDGKKALDYITYGLEHTTGQFRVDFMDALTELAPTFNGMGASADQAFDLIIAASKSGMENFDALSSITQSFTDNLIAGGEEVDAMFQKLGGNAQAMWKKYKDGNATAFEVLLATTQQLGKVKDEVLKNQIGAQLFGDTWTEAGAEAILSLGNIDGKLQGVQGTAQKVADAWEQSLGQKAQATFRKLQSTLAPFGSRMLDILNGVIPYIERAVDKFNGLHPVIQNLIVILGLVGVAIGPLIAMLGQFVLGLGVLTQRITLTGVSSTKASAATNAYTASLSRLGVTAAATNARVGMLGKTFGLLLEPFKLLGTLFLMFLPHIIMFIAQNEKAREVISNAWNAIVQAIQPVLIQIMNAIQQLKPVFENIGSSLGTVFASLVKTVTGLLSSLGPSLASLASSLGTVFSSIVQVGGKLLTSLTPVFQGILLLVSNVLVALRPVFDEFAMMFAELAPQFQQTGTILAQSFQQLQPALLQLGQALVELGLAIGQVFGQLAQSVLQVISILLPQLANTFASIMPVILQIVMSVIPVITQLIQAIIPVVLQIVSSVLPTLLQVVQAVFPVILQVIQQVIPIVLQVLLSIVPVILQIAKTVIPLILQAVQTVFPVILQIIQAVIPIVITVLKLAATFIRTVLVPAIQFILQIVQVVFPAILKIIQNAIQIITNIIKLFTSILKGDWKGAWDAVKNITSSVWNTIKTIISTAINVVKTTIQNVWNAIKTVTSTVWNGIKSVISSVWDGIKSTISNVVNGIRSTISNVFESIKSTATTVWNGIKNVMIKPVESAKDAIKAAIDKIKGFFSGLKLKIPEIQLPKLPKFSIEGKFSLTPPSVPKIKVSWNAKGGIFKEPTIFNTANAGLQGVGEAGPEAIIPLTDKVLGKIGAMIAATSEYRKSLSETLADSLAGKQEIHITVVTELDGYEIARNQFPYINEMMGNRTQSNLIYKGVR